MVMPNFISAEQFVAKAFANEYVTEERLVEAINSRENPFSCDDVFIDEMARKVYANILNKETWRIPKGVRSVNFQLLFKECAKRVAKILLNKQDD